MNNGYERIKKDFLSGRLKGCKSYFEKHGYYTEAGYCYIVIDKLNKAEENFLKAKEYDTRAAWGLFLIHLLRGDIESAPTYFQIRSFLEIDIDILLMYCKGDYIERIINYADFMAFYNPECYKFLGRAFWSHKFMPASMFFLRKAKDKFYQDPELHYLFAYIYYQEKNYIQCKKSLETCLNIVPEYNPAIKLQNKLAKIEL